MRIFYDLVIFIMQFRSAAPVLAEMKKRLVYIIILRKPTAYSTIFYL